MSPLPLTVRKEAARAGAVLPGSLSCECHMSLHFSLSENRGVPDGPCSPWSWRWAETSVPTPPPARPASLGLLHPAADRLPFWGGKRACWLSPSCPASQPQSLKTALWSQTQVLSHCSQGCITLLMAGVVWGGLPRRQHSSPALGPWGWKSGVLVWEGLAPLRPIGSVPGPSPRSC